MKQRILSLGLVLVLLFAGCAAPAEKAERTIVATTYPVYLLACAVTQGVDGVAVERLNTGGTSCLHDYTLSVNDMKGLARADVIAMNGADLEDFMEDALETSDAAVVDCSAGIELLENLTHHHEEDDHGDHDDHDHHDHGHWDPHIWMDPKNAARMAETLAQRLADIDPEHRDIYLENGQEAARQLTDLDGELKEILRSAREKEGWSMAGLITFHDGFQYFAHAYDLPLLESIEEEAGSEASAKEIVEITNLVKEHQLPVIFTEVNGSDATANAIRRETGCRVAQLTMLMDGTGNALSEYLNGQRANIAAVLHGFARNEVVR